MFKLWRHEKSENFWAPYNFTPDRKMIPTFLVKIYSYSTKKKMKVPFNKMEYIWDHRLYYYWRNPSIGRRDIKRFISKQNDIDAKTGRVEDWKLNSHHTFLFSVSPKAIQECVRIAFVGVTMLAALCIGLIFGWGPFKKLSIASRNCISPSLT